MLDYTLYDGDANAITIILRNISLFISVLKLYGNDDIYATQIKNKSNLVSKELYNVQ